MELTEKVSRHNYLAFLWHSIFLALAKNFMDVDTVIPAMLVESGGRAVHIGLITTIMLGGASFTQLFFAPILSNREFKKPAILLGINGRILSLLGLALLMLYSPRLSVAITLMLIFVLITLFSLGGAYAGICYTDILGKSIRESTRKSFFSIRQVIMGGGAFISAILVSRVLVVWEYPQNYAYMLLIGFLALLVASLGFWRLQEALPSRLAINSSRHFLRVARTELTGNPRLKYFLGFVNTQGISIAFLPFVILYAKETFQTAAADTGRFLIFKVAGGVLLSLLIFLLARNVKYRFLLYGNTVLALALPLLVLAAGNTLLLNLTFFLGGVVVSVYAISMNGVLLEISGNDNRTLYSGIAGAGNVIPALFPMVGGWLIGAYGFLPFFVLYFLILLASLFFIHRLNCLR